MTWTVGDLSRRLTALAEQVAQFPPDDPSPQPLVDPLCDIEKWADKHLNPEKHNRSCIDRIEGQAKSNEDTFHDMAEKEGDYANDERDVDEIFGESPLSVEREDDGDIHVQESWGGPSDGYMVAYRDGRIDSVRYYFRDWFDGAWLEIYEEDFPFTFQYLASVTAYVSGEDE